MNMQSFNLSRMNDLGWAAKELMFNVDEFCCVNLLRKTCTAFLFNEAVLIFAKLPCLI